MIDTISKVELGVPLSSILGGTNSETVVAVDAANGVLRSFLVAADRIEPVAVRKLGAYGGWSRLNAPFVQGDGCVRYNGCCCSISPCGNFVAVATPELPVLILALPGLDPVGETGGPGEARSVEWTEDPGTLLTTRLELRGEQLALVSHIRVLAGTGLCAPGSFLAGRSILAQRYGEIVTFADYQGEVKIRRCESKAPYRAFDFEGTCFIRPDGLSLSLDQGILGVIEFDRDIRVSVFDLYTWDQVMFKRVVAGGRRAFHAHNMSLLAFDDDAAVVFGPGGGGGMIGLEIPSGVTHEIQDGGDEVVGLCNIRERSRIVRGGAAGTVSLLCVREQKSRNRPVSSDRIGRTPLLTCGEATNVRVYDDV